MVPPKLQTFLLKIASRCNLACDYCYVYNHVDQRWRSQPAFMSDGHLRALARRLTEYVLQEELTSITVVFHGGEPLLAGVSRIVGTANQLRSSMPSGTSVIFSLQSNGTLLDEATIRFLAAAGIWISLSIDGGQHANDLHRVDHSGRSSFELTLRALQLLEENRTNYGGVISVIDPAVSPSDLFGFIAPRRPPLWDILLPDAHHERTPPGRNGDPEVYARWLLEAFDLWFDRYPELRVRLFDAILAACAGIPSDTDAFGLGRVNVLTIETDGSYHGHDVLKITKDGATSLGMNLDEHSISDAAQSPDLLSYGALLQLDGLSETCQACREVTICGGGSVPHRYSHLGFANPSVYCFELLTLIRHARTRMQAALGTKSLGPDTENATR
jgi:uncharacterized protein